MNTNWIGLGHTGQGDWFQARAAIAGQPTAVIKAESLRYHLSTAHLHHIVYQKDLYGLVPDKASKFTLGICLAM